MMKKFYSRVQKEITCNGRNEAFARLLERDGYDVEALRSVWGPISPRQARLLVNKPSLILRISAWILERLSRNS